jgi:hypothetical protein
MKSYAWRVTIAFRKSTVHFPWHYPPVVCALQRHFLYGGDLSGGFRGDGSELQRCSHLAANHNSPGTVLRQDMDVFSLNQIPFKNIYLKYTC